VTEPRHPGPWTLHVLAYFRADSVVSLGRSFPPTHALVRGVYTGSTVPETAIVEFALIDLPPGPSPVRFLGSFEHEAFESAAPSDELAWFPFEAELSIERNLERLRCFVQDCIALDGPRASPPRVLDEPPAFEAALVAPSKAAAAGQPVRSARAVVQRRAAQIHTPPPEPPPPDSVPFLPAPFLQKQALPEPPSSSEPPVPPDIPTAPMGVMRREPPPPRSSSPGSRPPPSRPERGSRPPPRPGMRRPPEPPPPEPLAAPGSTPPRRIGSTPPPAPHRSVPPPPAVPPPPPEPPPPEPIDGGR
jgi:hypothetical protein